MATTGEKFAGAAETIAESPWLDNTWVSPLNAVGVNNGTNASVTDATYDSGDQTFVLKCYGYDFSSIPAGSTIDGVIVRCYGVEEQAGAGAIGLVQLLSTARAKVGTNLAATEVAVDTNPTTYTFGSSTELWGNALTEAWVKDPDFGVAFGMWARAANTDVVVDAISIEVFYTAPPPKSTSVARVSLAAGGEPTSRTAHSIKVRARVTGGAGTIRAALYEGATNRSGDLESSALTGSLADYTLSIPDASAANITSYADLELRFWGYSATGEAITVEIDQIWLETPEASGPSTYFGVSVMPITFGKAVAGSRKTFGQTATPFTFGAVVSGRRKLFGQSALPIVFAKEVNGQRKTFGQLLSPYIFGKTVAGSRKTFGQTSLPITVGISSAGFRVGLTLFGVVSLPITFGKETEGRRKSFGQVSLPLSFGKETAARRTTFGQVSLPIIFTKEAAGQRDVFGQLSMATFFGKETAGSRKTFGQVALPIVFSKAVSGRKQTFGQVALPIEFEAFVDGFGFVGPKTLYGEVDFPIMFGKDTVAYRETFGQVTAPYIFGSASQGKRETFGEFEFPIDLLMDVESGAVGVHGQVSFPIVFGMDTDGIIKPIAIILNLADAVYLGSTPVIAVYTEGQQVWP